MNLTIDPSYISGILQAPPSKSVSHRAIICQSLAKGTGNVSHVLLSEDIRATCDAMTALGAVITVQPEENGRYSSLLIKGCEHIAPENQIFDCRESGSTLRFMIPIAALNADHVTFVGHGRLPERPLDVYEKCLTSMGVDWQQSVKGKALPLIISGRLLAGDYALPGNVSSQFITGLLFALPLLPQDSTIIVTTEMESAPYVAITLSVLRHFGIRIGVSEDYRRYKILGKQTYRSVETTVEGDYSQAAFWLAMGVLGKTMTVTNLSEKSVQGDAAIIGFIRAMGGKITRVADGFRAEPSRLHGIVMDVSQCPDLVPVLAVLAASAEGESAIIHAERLRIKESDRLAVMAEVLKTLGVYVEQTEDGLHIVGTSHFSGGTVNSHNDHRIAMASAVAALRTTSSLTIIGADSVKKSYPDFWLDYQNLGGKIS